MWYNARLVSIARPTVSRSVTKHRFPIRIKANTEWKRRWTSQCGSHVNCFHVVVLESTRNNLKRKETTLVECVMLQQDASIPIIYRVFLWAFLSSLCQNYSARFQIPSQKKRTSTRQNEIKKRRRREKTVSSYQPPPLAGTNENRGPLALDTGLLPIFSTSKHSNSRWRVYSSDSQLQ